MKKWIPIAALVLLFGASGAYHLTQRAQIRELDRDLIAARVEVTRREAEIKSMRETHATIQNSKDNELRIVEQMKNDYEDEVRKLRQDKIDLLLARIDLLGQLEAARTAAAPAQPARPTVVRRPAPPKPTVWEPAKPPVDLIQSAVQRRAKSYCEDQRKGVTGSLVFGVRVDYIGEPREVPGWTGRYEIAGEVAYNFYHSAWGGSFGTDRHYFTAQVEVSGKAAKIVDFTPRSSEPMGF